MLCAIATNTQARHFVLAQGPETFPNPNPLLFEPKALQIVHDSAANISRITILIRWSVETGVQEFSYVASKSWKIHACCSIQARSPASGLSTKPGPANLADFDRICIALYTDKANVRRRQTAANILRNSSLVFTLKQQTDSAWRWLCNPGRKCQTPIIPPFLLSKPYTTGMS